MYRMQCYITLKRRVTVLSNQMVLLAHVSLGRNQSHDRSLFVSAGNRILADECMKKRKKASTKAVNRCKREISWLYSGRCNNAQVK